MKNILIVSPHFYPNNFKCNDVAFELAKQGNKVTVLTDIPNYPGGKYFDGYGLFRRRREVIHGVEVIRTAVIPRGSGSGFMLALNYMSFALTACIRALFMGLFNKYDVVLVHETSPVTVGLPAVLIKKLRRKTKLLFWVLDLWPESLQVAGGVNNKFVLGIFERVAKTCYRTSDQILISSRGFKDSICEKGDFSSKIIYFPNWAEEALNASHDYQLPVLPQGFRIMFAGNIGEAQDFESTLNAMKILKERGVSNVHLILVGDGRKRQWVDKFIQQNSLGNTVHCVGQHPLESMGKFFAHSDVLYISLKDSLIFNLTCPTKLQAYMSAGKPILAMINGDGAAILKDAGCGLSVPSGASSELADKMLEMSQMSSESLQEMGSKGKDYCKEHFSFIRNMSLLNRMIDNVGV